jgi:hypothetical protein
MCTNMLTLNQDKTELIVFAPKHKVKSHTKLQFNFDSGKFEYRLHSSGMAYHVSYRCYQQVWKTWNKVSDQARIPVERQRIC